MNNGLLSDMKAAAVSSALKARRNYFAAYTLNVIIVVSSIAATILAATGKVAPSITAVFASIPAALLAVNTTFRFEHKSGWYWKKNKRINALIRSLNYENTDISAVSKAYSMLEEEMETEWVPFGGGQSTK